jgi:hypothetical protein
MWSSTPRSHDDPAAPLVRPAKAYLNQAYRRRLQLSEGSSISIQPAVECIACTAIAATTRPPPVGSLTTGGQPAVDSLACRLAEAPAGALHVIVYEGVVFPLHVIIGSQEDSALRVDFLTRLLLGAPPKPTLSAWPLTDALQQELCGRAGETTVVTARLQRQAIERVARWFLGAPVLALRADYSLPGDEAQNICRIHERMFDVLGIKPGDRVVIQWGHRSATATVLKQWRSPEADKYARSSGVRQLTADDIPEDYHISVPASALASFGAPRDAVVLVRRELVTLVANNALILAVPFTGLLLALINKMQWYFVVLVTGLLFVLSFLPLRRSEHAWPVSNRRI